jgi:mono/diheme cytochrome c family protein
MLVKVRRGAACAAMALAATALLALAGCGGDVKGDTGNAVHGKQLFVQKCGACHALARAGTKGTVGPDLDAAFAQSLDEGFRRNVIQGVVREQILYPSASGKMPAKLYTGQDASDVAAYVQYAAARPGDDTGALAAAVKSVSKKAAVAQGGKLQIDADPSGQLAYTASSATATAGAIEIDSQNKSSTPHNISLQEGTDGRTLAMGKVVSGGGVSTVKLTLKAGTYTFYCSVPGHREGGMVGKLTVR